MRMDDSFCGIDGVDVVLVCVPNVAMGMCAQGQSGGGEDTCKRWWIDSKLSTVGRMDVLRFC